MSSAVTSAVCARWSSTCSRTPSSSLRPAGASSSRRRGGREWWRSPSRTPGPESRRRTASGSSRSSSRRRWARDSARGPASASPSRSASSSCTAARSGWRASRGGGAASRSPCRPSGRRCGRADPDRRGQRAEHEADPRRARRQGLRDAGGGDRRGGGRACALAPAGPRADGRAAAGNGRRRRRCRPARRRPHPGDPGAGADGPGDARRQGAVPRRRLRRLPGEADRRRRAPRDGGGALLGVSAEPASRPRILVVDDVVENVRLLEAVLGPHGYDVIPACDGAEALDLVASSAPDLVLLDVVMPGLDGYAVCARLREHDDTAVLPVIMVTSSDGSEKTKAIEAGADDFIPKPFDHHELLTRVRSLLRIKRYHDTIRAQAAELASLNETL